MAHNAQVSDVRYALLTVDMEGGRILSVNEWFTSLTGYSPEDLERNAISYHDIVHPDDQDTLYSHMLKQLRGKGDSCCDHRIVTKEGHVRLVMTFVRVRWDADGRRVASVVVTDISSNKTAASSVRRVFDLLPCGVARYTVPGRSPDVHPRLVFANDLFWQMCGTKEAGKAVLPIVERDKALVARWFEEALAKEAMPVQCEFAIAQADGNEMYLYGTMACFRAEHGGELLCCFQDMTQLREAQEELLLETERFNLVASATDEQFFDYDVKTDLLTITAKPGAPGKGERRIPDFVASQAFMRSVHPDDFTAAYQQFEEAALESVHGAMDIRAAISEDAEKAWQRLVYTSVLGADGSVARVVGRIMNVDKDKQKEMRLKVQAERDSLTELYSRGATEMLIDDFLESENRRRSRRRHAMLMIDLDNFKEINDHFSHAFGDAMLVEIAMVLRSEFRATDIVGRYGGDEFVVLMKRYKSEDALRQVASRICAAVNKRFRTAVGEIRLSASIGISLYPIHGHTLAELFQKADMANYEAKAEGKNGYEIYAGQSTIRYQSTRGQGAEGNATLTFQDRVERVLLDTLREQNDRNAAVNAALKELALRLNAQRAYITEFTGDGEIVFNTYGYYEQGYEVDLSAMDRVPREALHVFCRTFDENGMRIITCEEDMPPALRPLYKELGVLSMLHYAYKRNGVICGFIGLDDCMHLGRRPDSKIMDEMDAVARVLTIFVRRQTTEDQIAALLKTTGLLDTLESYAYMVRADTYEVVFANRRMLSIAPQVRAGEICYRVIQGQEAPCANCPMRALYDSGTPRVEQKMRFAKLGFWGKVMTARLDYESLNDLCLFQCVDISAYKEAPLTE